jgi:hypothetical protein
MTVIVCWLFDDISLFFYLNLSRTKKIAVFPLSLFRAAAQLLNPPSLTEENSPLLVLATDAGSHVVWKTVAVFFFKLKRVFFLRYIS